MGKVAVNVGEPARYIMKNAQIEDIWNYRAMGTASATRQSCGKRGHRQHKLGNKGAQAEQSPLNFLA